MGVYAQHPRLRPDILFSFLSSNFPPSSISQHGGRLGSRVLSASVLRQLFPRPTSRSVAPDYFFPYHTPPTETTKTSTAAENSPDIVQSKLNSSPQSPDVREDYMPESEMVPCSRCHPPLPPKIPGREQSPVEQPPVLPPIIPGLEQFAAEQPPVEQPDEDKQMSGMEETPDASPEPESTTDELESDKDAFNSLPASEKSLPRATMAEFPGLGVELPPLRVLLNWPGSMPSTPYRLPSIHSLCGPWLQSKFEPSSFDYSQSWTDPFKTGASVRLLGCDEFGCLDEVPPFGGIYQSVESDESDESDEFLSPPPEPPRYENFPYGSGWM